MKCSSLFSLSRSHVKLKWARQPIPSWDEHPGAFASYLECCSKNEHMFGGPQDFLNIQHLGQSSTRNEGFVQLFFVHHFSQGQRCMMVLGVDPSIKGVVLARSKMTKKL